MLKNKALGAVNLFFCLVFGYPIFISFYALSISKFLTFSPGTYLQLSFFFIAMSVNAVLAYKLLTKKETHTHRRDFMLTIIVSFAPFSWIMLYYFVYLFAAERFFLLALILLILSGYYFLQKLSKKTAIYISCMTLLVTLLTIWFWFREDYCWKKGDQAEAVAHTSMTIATASDTKALQSFGIKKGQQIGISFRAHMLCYDSFNWSTALQEKYLNK